MTATPSSLFAGATKEPGKLLRFHVSLRIFTALSLAGRDAAGEQRRK